MKAGFATADEEENAEKHDGTGTPFQLQSLPVGFSAGCELKATMVVPDDGKDGADNHHYYK